MDVKEIATDKVIPYARNPRRNDAAVAAVAASIREFGFRQPIVVDEEMTVLVGHTRLKAAQSLGLAKVPVHIAKGLTESQRKAYRIADNKLNDLAVWDDEMLALELVDLQNASYDLTLTGFGDEEIKKLEAMANATTEGLTDPDDVPDVDTTDTRTKRGDIWLLGKHRIMCGDSTVANDVARLMGGEKAALCFTSPPYGQQRDYTEEVKEKVSDWDGLMRGVFGNLPMTVDGQVLVNLGMVHRENEWNPYWEGWNAWMRMQEWRTFGWYVWDQGFGLPGNWNGRFAPSHEFVFHYNKIAVPPNKCVAKKTENIQAQRKNNSTMRDKDGVCKAFSSPEASAQPNKIPDSIIRINRQTGNHSIKHPAIFPVKLPAFVMDCWPGIVYEPFLGSGTTLIAAEGLGRTCCGMEISPQYVDVTVKRWEMFTGKTAFKLESNT